MIHTGINSSLVAQSLNSLENLTRALKNKDVYLSEFSSADCRNTRHINLNILSSSKFFRKSRLLVGKSKSNHINKNILLSERNRLKLRINSITKLLFRTPIKKIKTVIKYTHYRRYLRKQLVKLNKAIFERDSRHLKDIIDKQYEGYDVIKVKKLVKSSRIYVDRKIRFVKNLKTYKMFFGKKKKPIIVKFKSKGKFFKFKVAIKRKKLKVKNQDSLLTMRNSLLIIESLFNTPKTVFLSVGTILNFNVDKNLFSSLYKSFLHFKVRLFGRNEDLYDDFIAVITLLKYRHISVEILGVVLSRLLSSIHKRKHGLFSSFLTFLTNQYLLHKTGPKVISGIKIVFSGRIFGRDIAKVLTYKGGSLTKYLDLSNPNSEMVSGNTTIKRAQMTAHTVYGAYGLKVSVAFKKNVSPYATFTVKEGLRTRLLHKIKKFDNKVKDLAGKTLGFHRQPNLYDSKDKRLFFSKKKRIIPKPFPNRKRSFFFMSVVETYNNLIGLKNRKSRINILKKSKKNKQLGRKKFLDKKRKKSKTTFFKRRKFSLVDILKRYRRIKNVFIRKRVENYTKKSFGKHKNKNYNYKNNKNKKYNYKKKVDKNFHKPMKDKKNYQPNNNKKKPSSKF